MTARSGNLRVAVPVPSPLPAILYGIGLGGFVDGIVLHQILQWHHLVSHTDEHPTTTVAGLEASTLADGFFHVIAWLFVVVATVVNVQHWRGRRPAPPWRMTVAGLLVGWGGFNLVEGLVNHQLLGIHHVRDDIGSPLGWDLGFLAVAVVQLAVGLLMLRKRPTAIPADSA